MGGLFDYVVFLEYAGDCLQGAVNLLHGVCGHKAEAYKGVGGGYGGRYHGVDEYAFVEEVACDGECLEVVAYEEGDDRGGCVAYLKTCLTESFESVVGELPEVFLTLRLGLHDFESLEGCGRRGRGDAGGEDVGA